MKVVICFLLSLLVYQPAIALGFLWRAAADGFAEGCDAFDRNVLAAHELFDRLDAKDKQ